MASSVAPRGSTGFFETFLHSEAVGSVILLTATAAALVCANSRWRGTYEQLQHATVGVTWGARSFSLPVHAWINEGLMTLFFFVVGLEIKREVVVGHLSAAGLAVLPGLAALGGMLAPAGIYAAVNLGEPGARGWGIPMATDIAFALGVLALLGPRAPLSLKVFLTALAIVDDLGAVLVIALFYTETIHGTALAIAGVCLVVFFLVVRKTVRRPLLLFLPVVGAWLAVLASGLHATVAGILAALVVPMHSRLEPRRFAEIVRRHLSVLEQPLVTRRSVLTRESQLDAVFDVHEAAAELQPPGLSLERFLHPMQAYVVLPLFAFFNAGIVVDARAASAISTPISLGVILGLVVGKPLGILLLGWLSVRSRMASLPADLGWWAFAGASLLAGIGFTMSLFVSDLAFDPGAALDQAKVGVLAGSVVAGVGGYLLLRLALSGSTTRPLRR